MEDRSGAKPARAPADSRQLEPGDLDRLIRFFRILVEWDTHRQTVGASPPTAHGVRGDDGSEDVDRSGALRARVLQGPGTRGLLDPRAGEAPPPVRAPARAHDRPGI